LYAHWSQRAERPDTAGQPLAPRARTALRDADHGRFQGGGDDHAGPGRELDERAAAQEQIARIPRERSAVKEIIGSPFSMLAPVSVGGAGETIQSYWTTI
jgi:hypothetical protein